MTGPRFFTRRTVAAAGLAAVTLAAHWPAIEGEFLLDDVGEIAANPAMRALWPPFTPMFAGGDLPHRPIPYYSFALNYAAHGVAPTGYHLVNILVHLVNGLFVWVICREVLAADRRLAERAAWVGTAAWLLHPLTTQAVDYVYQRIELLGATGILATVVCFLMAARSPQPRLWLASSILVSALAMLCKETAIAAPPAVLLVDWLGGERPPWQPWQGLIATLRRRAVYYAALTATVLVAVGVVAIQRDRFSELDGQALPIAVYAANQPLVIIDSLRNAFWPTGLCLDRYRLPSQNTAAMAAAGVVVGIAGVVAAATMRTRPRAALAILLFFTLLAPTSSVIPVNDLQVDHRMYLPLAVLMATVATLAARLLPALTFIATSTAVCLTLAFATHLRAAVFASRLAMWQDVVAKAPANPRGWAILADERLFADDLAGALVAIERSLAIEPLAPRAHTLRAQVLERLGRSDDAVEACLTALRLNPADTHAMALLTRLRPSAAPPQRPADWGRRAGALD